MTSASPGAYRLPDAARVRETEEGLRADEAEQRRVVAAMKSPFHALRQSLPRGPANVGLLLSAGAVVVPFVYVSVPLGRLAAQLNGRGWAAFGILAYGTLAGVAGASFGVVGMVKNRSPFASVVAFLLGVCAPVTSLLCGVVLDLQG